MEYVHTEQNYLYLLVLGGCPGLYVLTALNCDPESAPDRLY